MGNGRALLMLELMHHFVSQRVNQHAPSSNTTVNVDDRVICWVV